LAGVINRKRRPARKFRSQMVERLGQTNNASQLGNSLLLKSKWIARAIPPFVVIGNDLSHLTRKSERQDEFRTLLRVVPIAQRLSRHSDFIVGKLIGLGPDLTDVVEESPQRQRFLFSECQVNAVGQECGVKTDSAAVVEQLTVFRFKQIGKQREKVRHGFGAGRKV